MLILRLYEGKKIGLTQKQVIEHLIQEDSDNLLATQDPRTIAQFRKEREDHYENELKKSQNVTLIDENISGIWEHTLNKTPCYLEIIKEIINRYRR